MINRRSLLLAAGASLAAGSSRAANASTLVKLWPGEPPGGGGPPGPEQTSRKGAVSNVALPVLEVFTPERGNGAAMLIAAGGGYKRMEMASEAYPAARWLAARGVTAFVLHYRLPTEGWTLGPLAPLQDAHRALRLIRANASRYGIDPGRLGALGFSAGGHLLGLATTRADFAAYQPIDAIDQQPVRPAAAALIYPVITLKPPYEHTSTRKVLIGTHPTDAESAAWSVETHVTAACPPIFLVQAEDDPISNPANTLIMADACRRAGVPVELHRLPSGGHGFGMGRPGTPTTAWPDWYAPWLSAHHLTS